MGRHKKQHLKQRADGRYCAVYNGKQFMAWSEDEALKARQEYIDNEKMGIRPSRSVRSFGLEWLPVAYPKETVSDKTYIKYAIHLEKLIRNVGEKRLRDVTPLDIKNVYTQEYAGLSNAYILEAKRLFCALFDAAMAEGLCRTNPARNSVSKPHRGTVGGHRSITPQERYWIENFCTDHRAHAAAIVMLYAGLRPQEVKALNVDRDVDFEKGTITLNEFVHLENPYEYKRTEEGKTPRARRTIPLFAPVRKVLEGKHGYLTTRASGEPVNVKAWNCIWESYKNAMEEQINGSTKRWYGKRNDQKMIILPPWVEFTVVPYDLRHSFCTMCRDQGVELNTCIHWMGHADAKMILNVYDEWSEERGAREAVKVEKWLENMQSDMQ